jgi:hypothetical protein
MPSNGHVGNSGDYETNAESNPFHCLQNWVVGNSDFQGAFVKSNSLKVIQIG